MDILNMQIVQVAIAIVISWALFAIFVSFIQEFFAQLLGERGRFMKSYLLKQLKDRPNNINWALLIYQHGAIDLLIRESSKPTNDIEPRLFAEVLVETVGKTHAAKFKKQPTGYKDSLLDNFKSSIQAFEESDVMSFLQMAMRNAELNGYVNGAINESKVYNELIFQIEAWYGKLAERITLWYKKRIRLKLFIFGLILAIVINVDSIQLFNFFRMSPSSTTAIQHYYQNYVEPSTCLKEKQFVGLDEIKQADSLAKTIALPVGFDYSIFKESHVIKTWWVWKLIGLVITGFAVSFGAPFWFDVLKKFYTQRF